MRQDRVSARTERFFQSESDDRSAAVKEQVKLLRAFAPAIVVETPGVANGPVDALDERITLAQAIKVASGVLRRQIPRKRLWE